MAQLNFDAASVKPIEAMEAIPPGWYTAHMTASEMKPTSDGSGAFLNCEFTILAPAEYANRKVFTRLNLQNKNPAAQEIGYRTLSAICHAAGVIQVADSAQLHNRPMQIKVKLRPAGTGADGNHYEASNEINGYKAVDAVPATAPMAPAGAGGFTPPPMPPAAPAPFTAPAAPASPAPAATPPWAAAPTPVAPVAEAAPAAAPTAVPAAPATPPWAKPAA